MVQEYVIDKWIAWKEIKSTNTKYGLRATISLDYETGESKFYI